MKVAVLHFSGNVGKTTISDCLLMPRLDNPKSIPSPKVMPLLHEFCRFLRFGKCGHQLKTPHRFCQANLISAACIFAP